MLFHLLSAAAFVPALLIVRLTALITPALSWAFALIIFPALALLSAVAVIVAALSKGRDGIAMSAVMSADAEQIMRGIGINSGDASEEDAAEAGTGEEDEKNPYGIDASVFEEDNGDTI